MSDYAIKVEGLGKKYRIGNHAPYARFTELLIGAAKAPFNIAKSKLAAATSNASKHPVTGPSEFWALQDVNFTIAPGEIVGVIGRNGAGKSTLLKLLSRITEPTTGRIRYKGRVGSLLEVGTGFHPELTGRDNIFLNGAILGMTRAEVRRKFDEIVAFSEVEKFLDTAVKHYSSGMYMRLAFAVAAHLEPEILLVDEVLAVGDAEFQKKCLGKMSEVSKDGRTILFVSHNMAAIQQLCNSILHLKFGRVVDYGSAVQEIVGRYSNEGNEDSVSEWVNTDARYDNEYFIPQRMCFTSSDGVRLDREFRNDEDIFIQIEGVCKKTDSSLSIGYAIYTEQGQLLYWSYTSDATPDQWRELPNGHCVLRTPFPKRLLNEGIYRIELIGSLHYIRWLFEPGVNSPGISMRIQGGLSDSPLWMVKRPGTLAPVFKWEIL